MSIQNITLRILAQSETPEHVLQIAGGEGGIGAKGQPVRIQAVADVKYHLTDCSLLEFLSQSEVEVGEL